MLPRVKFIVNCMRNRAITVDHQLIPITIQPKNISLEQICYNRSQGIAVTSLDLSLFFPSKVLKLII